MTSHKQKLCYFAAFLFLFTLSNGFADKLNPGDPAPAGNDMSVSARESVVAGNLIQTNRISSEVNVIADKKDPIASGDAVFGGTITSAAVAPKSFNSYLDNNTFSYQIFGSLYETLLSTDPVTGEPAPSLARGWKISDDKKTFTFFLNPLAKWSDGKAITAEDVLWTFNTIMAPTNQTGAIKVALKTFADTPPEIIDDLTIKFTASEVHWRNLNVAGGFEILPKHIYESQDFNKINSVFPVVSGPYELAEIKEGISVTLRRRSDWWGRALKASEGLYNFDKIVFRFFAEQDNAFEAFLAGDIDVYPVYRASIWAERTSGKKFDNNWIVKRKISNRHPIGFQGFAMNLRRAPFDDLRVRKALAMLLNRRRLVETLMYNQYFLHKSYYENIYSNSNKCHNISFGFDPSGAAKLLDESGWVLNKETNIRQKNGKNLSFTFLTRDSSSDKFLALYSEDLKKAGIEMKIERKDFAAWVRDMDDFNYDMTWAAWSGGLNIDPEGMWSSDEADRKGGNNITGFKNDMIDKLIETQRAIFNLEERNKICRRIDQIITENVPYILLWNTKDVRLLYWDKFGMPPTVLSKFGDERSLFAYWWYDEESVEWLIDAISNDEPLGPPPDVVDFDTTFTP